MHTKQASIAGIDISKDKADVFIQGESWVVGVGQISALTQRLKDLQPQWIILEPTGGYEMPWVQALNQAGFQVARPHVTRMSYHARGKKSAKTDKLDARALAHYGECYQAELRAYRPDETQLLLQALYQRRQQLVAMRVEEKNRLSHAELPKTVRKGMLTLVQHLNLQIEQVEEELRQVMNGRPDLKERQTLLESMVGIGELGATGLLALLPELGNATRKEIAALAGVVPYERSSGQTQKKTGIRGGRFAVRQLLYMATLSAIRYCPPIRELYARLKAKGKSSKQALVACMHKMLRILNAMLKDNQPFRAPS